MISLKIAVICVRRDERLAVLSRVVQQVAGAATRPEARLD
jgi:hypothetical protein